jgi:hypothetical protein
MLPAAIVYTWSMLQLMAASKRNSAHRTTAPHTDSRIRELLLAPLSAADLTHPPNEKPGVSTFARARGQTAAASGAQKTNKRRRLKLQLGATSLPEIEWNCALRALHN